MQSGEVEGKIEVYQATMARLGDARQKMLEEGCGNKGIKWYI